MMIRAYFKFRFSELFESNKQIEFVGTDVLDGPQITLTRQKNFGGSVTTIAFLNLPPTPTLNASRTVPPRSALLPQNHSRPTRHIRDAPTAVGQNDDELGQDQPEKDTAQDQLAKGRALAG